VKTFPHISFETLRFIVAGALVVAAFDAAGELPVLDRVRFQPAPGKAEAMLGGTIAGSNAGPTSGFKVLATIESVPDEGNMSELVFANPAPYRYIIYEGPIGSRGAIAEVEFYDGDERLHGTAFGVAGSFPSDGGGPFPAALDRDPATFFESSLVNGAYVGYDLGSPENIAEPPSISPSGGSFAEPQTITLAADPGLTIHYTTDGSPPSRLNGTPYTAPFVIGAGATSLRAVAFSDSHFASEWAASLFLIGPDAQIKTVSSYHIGNSLTDTFVNQRLEAIASSAGFDPLVYKFTIPGAPTEWLWDHPGKGFGTRLPSGTRTNDVAAAFPEVAPLMHLSVQPFSGGNRPLDNELEHIGFFYERARRDSPDLQLWLYTQWPNYAFDDGFSKARRLRDVGFDVPAATSWEEGVRNHMRYFEELRNRVDAAHAGPSVKIIPTALALLRLKAAQERGEIPGLDPERFLELHWADEGQNIHTSDRGSYFVSLVVYCSIYGLPPYAIRLPESTSAVTPDQDKIYKRIAWETVRAYRWGGIDGLEFFNQWRDYPVCRGSHAIGISELDRYSISRP